MIREPGSVDDRSGAGPHHCLPYAMLANSLPSRKMGVNIGIFNIFIVIPQLLAARALPLLLDVLPRRPSYALVIGAGLVPRRRRRAHVHTSLLIARRTKNPFPA